MLRGLRVEQLRDCLIEQLDRVLEVLRVLLVVVSELLNRVLLLLNSGARLLW